MACDANSLASEARCLCLTPDEHLQVQTHLLATLAGASSDPSTLRQLAACFLCMSPDDLLLLKTYLFCQLAAGSGALPAGPTADQWSLFLDEGFAFLFASDNGSGFTHYCFRYRLNGGAWVDGVPTGVDDTVGPFGAEGDVVEAQTRYCDAGGTALSQWSGIKEVTNADPCSEAVATEIISAEGIRGTDPSGYQATIAWAQHPGWETILSGSKVYRSDTELGTYNLVIDLTGDPNATGGTDDGTMEGPLTPETTYWYKVGSLFNNGCPEALSAPFEMNSGCHAETPANYAVSGDPGITACDVEWAAPSANPILDYVVAWGTTMGGPYPNTDTALNTDLAYQITGLTASTTYFSVLRARDTLTCTALSAEISFTTADE